MGSVRAGMVSLIFPGQGSQHTGMGRRLFEAGAAAADVFRRADEALGFSLSGICFEGPREKLNATEYCQPAVYTTSYACFVALRDTVPRLRPAMLAGHSLGELTALAVSGCFSFEQGLRLVYKRGRLMARAGKKRKGTMCAVIGMKMEKLEEICAEYGLTPANLNCPGQVVVSGTVENIERAGVRIKSAGGKVIPLTVSGAFHSPAMREAAAGFAKELEEADFGRPEVPVLSNVTAGLYGGAEDVRRRLVEQLYSPVRWHESVLRMIGEGSDVFIETGPGRVLSKLVSRIDSVVSAFPVNDMETALKAREILAC